MSIRGEIYKFCGNRGEYTICIIGLRGGWTHLGIKCSAIIFQALAASADDNPLCLFCQYMEHALQQCCPTFLTS